MRKLPALVIVLGLLLVGGLAWWMLGQSALEESHEAALGAVRDEAPAAADLPQQQAATAEALHVAVPEAPLAAAAPEVQVPESYRRALGGLKGRVLTAEGAPVPGLPLSLLGGRRSLLIRGDSAFLQEGGLDFNPVAGQSITDAQGRFTLRELEPRTLGALLLDPGGPRALLWPLEITPVSGEVRDLGDIKLPEAVTLRGRIVDEHGQPIAGARIRATDFPYASVAPDVAQARAGGGAAFVNPKDDKSFAMVPPVKLSSLISLLPVPTTSSGEDGRFELAGVTPGVVTLAVDEPDHLVSMQGGVPTGAAGGTRDVGDVLLGGGVTVSGHVLDSAGHPVPGAELLLGNPLGVIPGAVLRGPYTADANGAFSAHGYRVGAVWAVARADAHQQWTIVTDLDAERSAEIKLTATRTLTLSLLDKRNATVTDAKIYGRAVPDKDAPDLLIAPHELNKVSRDEQGRYVIGGLQPEPWEIVVKAPGRPVARAIFELAAGDTSGEMRLEDGRALPVRVLDPQGAPVEWAQLAVQRDAFEFGEAPLATARTGADGRAWLTDLPTGEIFVIASHPAWAAGQEKTSIVEPPDGAQAAPLAELVVKLSSGGTVVGQVFDGGGPPSTPLMVIVVPEKAAGDEMIPRVTLSDLEGKFRFERVAPGETHVEVRDPQSMNPGLSLFESFIDSPLAEEKVEVQPQGESSVVLDISAQYKGVETGTLSGTVTVNGLPGEGWKIRTWGQIRRSVTADANGRFDMGRIEAGDVELMLSAPNSKFMEGVMQQHSVHLGVGEAQIVNISLTTATVDGRVVSAITGEGVAAAQVQLRAVNEQGYRSGGTIAGPDGRFHFDGAAAGTYRVSVRSDGFANTSSAPFELKAQENHSGVLVRLSAGLKVSGKVVIEGEKPSWLWLIANSSDNETHDSSSVDKKDLTFSFDGLTPGEWSFQLASDLDAEFDPVKLQISGDMENLVLTFKPKPPEPPEPANAEATASDGK